MFAGSTPSDDSVAGTSGETCTEDRAGGDLTISEGLFARGLDPLVNLGTASAGGIPITAMYDTLLRFNPQTGEYEPFIAESVVGNEDSTEWTVTLRDGVTFSNGDPLNAEAVKFSLERMRSGTGSASNVSQLISEVEVIDDLSLVVRLSEPWGSFRYALSEETGMVLNPNVVAEMPPEEFNVAPPEGAGAGPYVLESFTPDEAIVLRARDDYWGGPVCIDTLTFVPIVGGKAKWDAYRSGEIDLAFITDPRVIADMQAEGAPMFGIRGGLGRMLTLNVQDEELQDLRIRQAIQYAIDYETLNQRVYEGHAGAASSIMPPESPIYGGPGLGYDLDEAIRLVEEAKADGWDGTLEFVSPNAPDETETALAVAAMLQAVGIEATPELFPPSESTNRILVERNYQMGLYGPATFEESVVNDVLQFRGGSPSNPSGVADPGMDEAINEVIRATDREQARAAMEDWQVTWNEVLPAVNLFMVDWFVVLPDGLDGVIWARDMVPMFNQAFLAD